MQQSHLFSEKWVIYNPENYNNLYIMYPDGKHYVSAPCGCFWIFNIFFRSWDIDHFKCSVLVSTTFLSVLPILVDFFCAFVTQMIRASFASIWICHVTITYETEGAFQVNSDWLWFGHVPVHARYRFLQILIFVTNYFNIVECWFQI